MGALFSFINSKINLVFCFLLRKDKNQVSIASLLEGSIGLRYIFIRPQKWPETRFLWLFTPFFSKTGANFLLPSPDLDSTGKNLSKSVIIGQVPKSMSDSVILMKKCCSHIFQSVNQANLYGEKNKNEPY